MPCGIGSWDGRCLSPGGYVIYGGVHEHYSNYCTRDSGGAECAMRGRLTEMFVRRDGKWLDPGWHLDLTAGPALSQP